MEVSPIGLKAVHPCMHEYLVQAHFQDLRLPLNARQWMLRVGLDSDGCIGAIQQTQVIDAGSEYNLVFGAVAVNLRGRGLFIGDEMIEDTVEQIALQCAEMGVTDDVLLTTQVHRDNRNSQKMCHRNKFRNMGSLENDEYDDWHRDFTPPPPIE